MNNKIIFTGGGSGGHLSIMKGLIDYLKTTDYNMNNLLVVGGKLGMINDPGKSLDERRIPEFGVNYKFIRGGKLHRALRWQTFMLLWGFIPGFWDAFSVIKKFKPDIIFATGGYVTLPMIIAGKILGKKVVIHEQTLTAGLTNKIGAKFADKILVTFEQSKNHFPIHKTKVTGNIIRKEVFSTSCDKNYLVNFVSKNNDKPLIYITGGSLGAHRVNLFFEESLEILTKKYSFIWQTGENELYNDFGRIQKKIEDKNYQSSVYLTKYVYSEIGYVLNESDYVVCRPGANTLYELAALGKKSIMIPLWVTAAGDQLANAKWFKENYVGEILTHENLTIENFDKFIQKLEEKEATKMNLDFENIEKSILKEIFE